MALSEDMALLNRVELFRELGEEKLRLIAFGAERRKLQAGQMLFREGSPADCAFVVAGGSFALSRTSRNGPDQSLGAVGTGTLLGELALISQVDRSVTAIAAEAAEIIRVNRPLFHRMLEEYPEIAEIIRARIAANLERLARDVGTIAPRFSS